MKQSVSILLSVCLLASMLLFGACGKKHTIDTSVELGGNESVSGAAGVVYENVTDENGENVTDAEGETVTVAVPVEEPASDNSGSDTKEEPAATEKDKEANQSPEASTRKGETTTAKKGETTTKKNESSTKKNETATKKSETTTKKNETATKKSETTTKKSESTTKKQETTQAPTTQAPKVVVNPGDYVFALSTDKTEVSPGDTVTVTLKLKNCKNVACFNIYVKCGARKGIVETDKFKSNRFVGENGSFDIYSNNENKVDEVLGTEDKGVLFGGMTTRTYSFINDDLCTVTFKVTSMAQKGEVLVFSAVTNQFLVSPDDSGSSTQDVSGDIEVVPVMVTVK